MDLKVAQRISNSEDGRVLLKYLAETILSLDTLEGLDLTDPFEYIIEGKARQRAKNKLEVILSTLITGKEVETVEQGSNEYLVDVE